MPFLTQGSEGEPRSRASSLRGGQSPYGVNKTNWKYILIVLVLAVIVGGGILGWQWLGLKYEVPSMKISPRIEKKEAEIEPDWKIYRNEWYGFELMFPERWKEYEVKEERDGVEFKLRHSKDNKYRPVFGILVVPKEIWEQSGPEERSNLGTYLGKKGNNVFVYYLWKTYGDEGYVGFPEAIPGKPYQGPFFDVQTKIIPTFKFVDLGICEYHKGEYEMRVYDSQGRITGLVNGQIKEEIPNSLYDSESGDVVIFDPKNSYIYEFFCIKRGNYQFGESFIREGEVLTFNAINIPISPGETHRYKIDWDTLLREEEGVILQIDTDGDGVFEKTIKSDIKLTCQEFIAVTRTKESKDETANWKTYKDGDYGFEFKYPKRWGDIGFSPSDSIYKTDSTIIFNPPEFEEQFLATGYPFLEMRIKENPQKLDVEDFYFSLIKEYMTKEKFRENLISQQVRGIIYYQFPTPWGELLTIFPLDSAFLEFSHYTYTAEQEVIFNQMLSTFRFLE